MKRYAIGVAVLAVTGSVCAQAVQWTEAEGGNGHWYAEGELVGCWTDAVAAAETLGGHLPCIGSAGENDFFAGVVSGYTWLGLFQDLDSPDFSEPDGGWTWITGEPFTFVNWGAGEPNDGVGEADDWGEFWPDSHQWNDLENCTGGRRIAIEWSADCNGDGIVDYGQILDGTYADDDGNGVPDCCDPGGTCDAVQWIEADGGNGHWYKVIINVTPASLLARG